ncbi:MAG: 4'-phosphopantetheinyl transferase superfamily protein [Pseudomonadota bacterium]
MSDLPVPRQIVWQPVSDWPTLTTGECHLWQLDLASFPGQPALLDDAEQKRWQGIKPPAARRFCVTRTALRQLLGHYLCCEPAEVAIRLGAQGKPELTTASQPLFFNLSHSAEVAVLAFYATGPVGVDVERPRRISAVPQTAKRIFAAPECDYLHRSGDDPHVFLRLWVRHEARQKCLGLGLLQTIPEPVALDYFAGTWSNGLQLGLAWASQTVPPELHFFQLH